MEFVDDFVYFKGGEDGFDEDGVVDGVFGYVDVVLSKVEDIVLEMGFKVRFYFGKVEVRVEVYFDGLEGIVEEV